MCRGCDFFGGAQFSRKLARLYEYSYLGPVFYMNIHIAHDTKVFVTLRDKKKAMKYPFPVLSPNPNPNYNTKSKPLHHKQLQKTMHPIRYLPISSIPTSSIPIWSTSHFVNSHFVNSHLVNVDKARIDKMGIDEVGS